MQPKLLRRQLEKKVRSLSTPTYYVLGVQVEDATGEKPWPVELIQEKNHNWSAKVGGFSSNGRSHKEALANLLRAVFVTAYGDGLIPGTKSNVVRNAVTAKQEEINALKLERNDLLVSMDNMQSEIIGLTADNAKKLEQVRFTVNKIVLISNLASSRDALPDPAAQTRMLEVIEKLCAAALKGVKEIGSSEDA